MAVRKLPFFSAIIDDLSEGYVQVLKGCVAGCAVTGLIYMALAWLFWPGFPWTAVVIAVVAQIFNGTIMLLLYMHQALREAEQRQELRILSTRDDLTGLLNRRSFTEAIEEMSSHPDRHYVALADIDFFKSVNDRYGHHAGDQVIRAVAEEMKCLVSGRLGGEEFGLLLAANSEQEAIDRIDTLRLAIAARMVDLEDGQGGTICVTMSFGLAPAIHGLEPIDIIRAADTALYLAKEAGRNCVRVVRQEELHGLVGQLRKHHVRSALKTG
jgi:diguanylate cyclase (GGDEF)-like protein